MGILAVVIIGLVALGLSYDNWRLRKEYGRLMAKEASQSNCIVEQNAAIMRMDGEITELLRQKAAPQLKSEVFADRDKIPALSNRAYVPIGRRRQQAETASMGPQTHDAKVRENNEKAMERAG